MFRALLCQSLGARGYDIVYYTGRVFLGLLYNCAWACNWNTTPA